MSTENGSQVWLVVLPENDDRKKSAGYMLGIFDLDWSAEEIAKAFRGKFYNLKKFTMQRISEGSFVTGSFDGFTTGSTYNEDGQELKV